MGESLTKQKFEVVWWNTVWYSQNHKTIKHKIQSMIEIKYTAQHSRFLWNFKFRCRLNSPKHFMDFCFISLEISVTWSDRPITVPPSIFVDASPSLVNFSSYFLNFSQILLTTSLCRYCNCKLIVHSTLQPYNHRLSTLITWKIIFVNLKKSYHSVSSSKELKLSSD